MDLRRRRPADALATAVLAVSGVAGVAGCGGGEGTEGYCDAVREQAGELRRLSGSAGESADADLVQRLLVVFDGLAEQAPDDVADEWTTFVFAWRDLDDALERDDERAVEAAAGNLTEQRVVDAAAGIERHARDVCGVDLGTGGLDF
jgi:hypothetical protein